MSCQQWILWAGIQTGASRFDRLQLNTDLSPNSYQLFADPVKVQHRYELDLEAK